MARKPYVIEEEPGEFKLEFPTRYNAYKRDKPRVEFPPGEGRAVQDAIDECDINVIMKKYIKTGVLPPGVGIARYGDFSSAEDFLDAQNTIIQAKQQFDALPSAVRARFQNSPTALLAFLGDRKNLEEARSLGLLKEEPVKAAQAATGGVSKEVPGAGSTGDK